MSDLDIDDLLVELNGLLKRQEASPRVPREGGEMRLQLSVVPKSIIETRKLSVDRALTGRVAILRKPPAREACAWELRKQAERRSA